MAAIQGREVASTATSRTQVYNATHKDGQYLSDMNRSFISFSYGGKHIEDFNLIAVTNGDRMEKEAYAPFDDLTTNYDVITGQFYWGTYFRALTLSFTLFTDGIDEQQLDEFKYWFRAGEIKELILAEHPNRAIMARVATQPHLSLLPFEKPISIKIGGISYDTSTTLYKGEIELEMVADDPFWYAKQNILGVPDTISGYYSEYWQDVNGVTTAITSSKDALKIIYEDRIPLGSTIGISVFLGGDVYAKVVYELYSQTQSNPISAETYNAAISAGKDGYYTYGGKYYTGARIQENTAVNQGRTAGANMATEGTTTAGITLAPDHVYLGHERGSAYLYYAGTAPAPVKLKFSLRPVIHTDWGVIRPTNKYYTSSIPYNTITLYGQNTYYFRFSLPSLYAGVNQAQQVLSESAGLVVAGQAWLNVREAIRDTVKDSYVRAWVNKILDYYESIDKDGKITLHGDSTNKVLGGHIKQAVACLLLDATEINKLTYSSTGTGEHQIQGQKASFVFDGNTGASTGTFKILKVSSINLTDTNLSGTNVIARIKESVGTDDSKFQKITQNVGDMVKSNYLVLQERNKLDSNMQIGAYSSSHKDYSYLIRHNYGYHDDKTGIAEVSDGLTELHFEFKNLYL